MQTQNTAAIDGVVPTSIAGVATTHPHQLPPSKKRTRTDATAKAVRVGKTWTARLRRSGHDVYETGHKTRADAELAAAKELARRKAQGEPFGKGPKKTSFAHALRDYAKAKLPYMKGAKQEISRINFYLRQAKLPTLKVIPVEGAHVHFKVEFDEWTPERVIPNGLHAHRKQLAVKTADSMRLRAVLATKMVADILFLSRHEGPAMHPKEDGPAAGRGGAGRQHEIEPFARGGAIGKIGMFGQSGGKAGFQRRHGAACLPLMQAQIRIHTNWVVGGLPLNFLEIYIFWTAI